MKNELTDKVDKMYERLGEMPFINTRIYKSKSGKYLINEVNIKTIKPVKYYEAIVNRDRYEENE